MTISGLIHLVFWDPAGLAAHSQFIELILLKVSQESFELMEEGGGGWETGTWSCLTSASKALWRMNPFHAC